MNKGRCLSSAAVLALALVASSCQVNQIPDEQLIERFESNESEFHALAQMIQEDQLIVLELDEAFAPTLVLADRGVEEPSDQRLREYQDRLRRIGVVSCYSHQNGERMEFVLREYGWPTCVAAIGFLRVDGNVSRWGIKFADRLDRRLTNESLVKRIKEGWYLYRRPC